MHNCASEVVPFFFPSYLKNGNSQALPSLASFVLGFFFTGTEHQALVKPKRNGTPKQILLPLEMNPVDWCSFLQTT